MIFSFQKMHFYLDKQLYYHIRNFAINFLLFLIPQIMKPSVRRTNESVSNFIEKTYEILEDPENQAFIYWSHRGTSFIIRDVRCFENQILPKYFKHSHFTSFVRQLNMYNFHKVRGQKHQNQFQHDKFRKGQRQLLCKIKRKQNDLPVTNMSCNDGTPINTLEQIQEPGNIMDGNTSKDQQQAKQSNDSNYLRSTLQQIQTQNKVLRKNKQKLVSDIKLYNTTNGGHIGQKFYKLMVCLFMEKIKNQNSKECKIQENGTKLEEKIQEKSIMSLDELIEHVVGVEEPYSFYTYQNYAKTLMKKHTDQFFMLQKSKKSIQDVKIQ